MKIAILAKIVNTKSGSRAAIDLAKALAKNHQVIFLAGKENSDPLAKKSLEKEGVQVKLTGWRNLFSVLKNEKPDLINSHAPLLATLMAKLTAIPIVSTYYGTQLDAYLERLLPHQKPSLKDDVLNWLGNQWTLTTMKLRLALANQVVAISRYTTSEAKKLYNLKIPFVYLGADSESLVSLSTPASPDRLDSSKRASGSEVPATNLLSVSRFTPYKGFHILIEVIQKLKKEFPKISLTLVGSASDSRYLKYLKSLSKGQNVSILTNISDAELSRQYRQTDIYLSWDRYLFFGLPVLEAGLFGKPSVVFRACAAEETVIHGETGYLAQNQKELKKYLKKLIKKPNLRKKIGLVSQRQARKFSWQTCAQNYEKIFNQVR